MVNGPSRMTQADLARCRIALHNFRAELHRLQAKAEGASSEHVFVAALHAAARDQWRAAPATSEPASLFDILAYQKDMASAWTETAELLRAFAAAIGSSQANTANEAP